MQRAPLFLMENAAVRRPPLVFIGSSHEALPIAQAIQRNLKGRKLDGRKEVLVRLWSQGIFLLGDAIPARLIETAATFDFAVLVFSPDDVVLSHGVQKIAPRDNLVFELGLFAGQLGPERTFVVVHDPDHPKLPTDFAGVVYATYTIKNGRNKVVPMINKACAEIMGAVERLGQLRHPRLEATLLSIIHYHRLAFKVDYPAFQQFFENWCGVEQEDSKAWGEGLMRINNNYASVVTQLYGAARSAIFSTCVISATRRIWCDQYLGALLLRSQAGNKKAKSTRVFIYAEKERITPEDIKLMEQHRKNRVEVRIHRSSRVPGVTDEWTMIDNGEAVGITQSVEAAKGIEAHWYFRDGNKSRAYQNRRDELERLSVTLDEWLSSQLRGSGASRRSGPKRLKSE